MRLALAFALLLLGGCAPPAGPSQEGGAQAPSVTVGGSMRGLYGVAR